MSVMRLHLILISFGLLFWCLSLLAEDKKIQKFVFCKKNGVVRTIRAEVNKDGQCSTFYTKSGIDEVVGMMKDQKACQQIIKNIKTNLLQGSWNCKDASNTQMSDSSKIQ